MTKTCALLTPRSRKALDLLGRLDALAKLNPDMIYGEAAAEIRRLRTPRPKIKSLSKKRRRVTP